MTLDRPRPDGRERLNSVTKSVGAWTIEATWFQDDPQSDGPLEVTLSLPAGADEATVRRGLTTGVMRQLEARLTEMTREHHEFVSSASDTDTFEALTKELKEMKTPRGAPNYYPRLLEAYELCRRINPSEPVNRLSRWLGVPKGTLTTRLDVAKRQARAAAEAGE